MRMPEPSTGKRSRVGMGNECFDFARWSREELVARWVEIYGIAPPKGIRRALLERAASWHAQARRKGGLSPSDRRALRCEPTKHFAGAKSAAAVDLQPGTRLLREWGGTTHSVAVTDKGCVWNGKAYRSLSAVAFAITGARWSGPRFFGLHPSGDGQAQ